MSDVVVKEQKFMCLIIPMKDADGFADKYPDDIKKLDAICYDYEAYRESLGKNATNDYIIVNQDEPYAEKIWQIILEGERLKVLKGGLNG
jgi:hypothetical protein